MKVRRQTRDKITVGNCVLAERAGRRSAGYAKALHRLREIDRLIADRHGQFVPVDRISGYLAVAAFCHQDTASSLAWIQRYAPTAVAGFDDLYGPVRLEKEGRRWNLSVQDAGARVGLTFDERQRLGIATMWAADMPIAEQKEAIKEARKKRDRLTKAAKRRGDRIPRADWLATRTLSRSKPWMAEGIDRATWFRRRKRERATVVSQHAHSGATVVSQTENIGDVPYVVSDQPVAAPSIIPETSDLTSSRRRAGSKRPAPNVQLDLFELGDAK